ncbi:hypothetical protein Y032_0491g2396 [Ancylostoma ceylanicum]|uniref:Uncharacterized protein n=1 Tax=Ancylostoma ceylanicum TaxID=53326 RepID=A0A016WUN4_9BILA|nr:hypothetical protein Y032_0491g2396 [Ancylostoma ceylanicum]
MKYLGEAHKRICEVMNNDLHLGTSAKSPICGLVGSLLSRPLGSLDSLFPPILRECHQSEELFHRPYFIGSLSEVNTLVSVLHSSALSKVSSNDVRTELGDLRSRLPKFFSSNVNDLDSSETSAESSSVPQTRQHTRVLFDKVNTSVSTSPPKISSRSHHAPGTASLLPSECFDVVVFHIEGQS